MGFENKENHPKKLTEDEQHLIASWNKLSRDNKLKAIGNIEFMYREEVAAREKEEAVAREEYENQDRGA
jgi:hypothetical protein